MMAKEQQKTLRFVRENTTQTSQPSCLDNNGGMEAGQPNGFVSSVLCGYFPLKELKLNNLHYWQKG